MPTITPTTKIVVGAGSLGAIFFAVILAIAVPAVRNHLDKVDEAVKANILQSAAIAIASKTNDRQDLELKVDTTTNATQNANIGHNSKRIDNFALILKDFLDITKGQSDQLTSIQVGMGRLEVKLDSFEVKGND